MTPARARIVGGVDRGTNVVTDAGLRRCCSNESNDELSDSADVSVLLRPERVHVETPGGGAAADRTLMKPRSSSEKGLNKVLRRT